MHDISYLIIKLLSPSAMGPYLYSPRNNDPERRLIDPHSPPHPDLIVVRLWYDAITTTMTLVPATTKNKLIGYTTLGHHNRSAAKTSFQPIPPHSPKLRSLQICGRPTITRLRHCPSLGDSLFICWAAIFLLLFSIIF